jgi:hypothetical protein
MTNNNSSTTYSSVEAPCLPLLSYPASKIQQTNRNITICHGRRTRDEKGTCLFKSEEAKIELGLSIYCLSVWSRIYAIQMQNVKTKRHLAWIDSL